MSEQREEDAVWLVDSSGTAEQQKRKRGRPRGSVNKPAPEQTHCKRGHELAGDNLVLISKGRGSDKFARGCRACRKLHREQSRERSRANQIAGFEARSPLRARDKAVQQQRVEALFTVLQQAIDCEVLRGDAGETVARLALERLVSEGYVVTEPAE